MYDYYSGLDGKSLRVVADFPIDAHSRRPRTSRVSSNQRETADGSGNLANRSRICREGCSPYR